MYVEITYIGIAPELFYCSTTQMFWSEVRTWSLHNIAYGLKPILPLHSTVTMKLTASLVSFLVLSSIAFDVSADLGLHGGESLDSVEHISEWNHIHKDSNRNLVNQLPPGPKLYLYVWAGSSKPGTKHHDFLSTFNVTGTNETYDFGNLLSVVDMPTFGNEPHHVGLSRDGSVLALGNLWAYRQNNPDMYFVDTATDPSTPKLINGAYGINGSVVDSFVPIDPVGGKPAFLVGFMGNRQGTAPGRLGEINYNNVTQKYEVVREWNGGLNGTIDNSFLIHGYDRNGATGNVLLSVDYVDISSSFKPTTGLRVGSNIRVWDFISRTVVNKYDLGSNSNGLMSVRWLGSGQKFYFTAGKGSFLFVDALSPFIDGGNPKIVYNLSSTEINGSCVMSNLFKSSPSLLVGDRMFITALGLNEVRLLNITDPLHPVTLQTLHLGKKGGGHVVIVDNANNASLAAVSTYYVEQRGKLNGVFSKRTKKQVILFKIASDKNSFSIVKTIDFKTLLKESHGVAQPHGMAFKSFVVS